MQQSTETPRGFRFGVFEADLQSGEVRKSGRKVRLQEQPFQVLAMLLERAGEVVTREELQKKLWPEDTFVDFDHGLNIAINKIREALSDSAENPRFVETIPKRGYRFIAPVVAPESTKPAAIASTAVLQEGLAKAERLRPKSAAWSYAAVSLGVLLVAGLSLWNFRFPEPRPITRVAVTMPPTDALAGLEVPAVAISPDGRNLAYVAIRGGTQRIFLRAMDSQEAKPIEGTEGAVYPFFSPDGQWLGFFSGTTLKKISTTGGVALTLCNVVNNPRGAFWGVDGMIYLGSNASSLSRVLAAGGTPQPVTKLDPTQGERAHRWPQLLPGGNALLFTIQTGVSSNSDEEMIAVQNLQTGERKLLVRGGTHGRYLASGHLAYVRGGALMAAPFDLKRLEVAGAALPVTEGIRQHPVNGNAQLSIADEGSLVYISGSGRETDRTLAWVDRTGREQPLGAPARPYGIPRLSPDGHLLAVSLLNDIWIYDLLRGTLSRLTIDGASRSPVWSPDGKRIIFQSARDGKPGNLFWKFADGSGQDERLTSSDKTQIPSSWSPDGQVISFSTNDPSTRLDLWMLPASGGPLSRESGTGESRKPHQFLRTPYYESGAIFSPDGRWLAYVSNETGQYEVYVQSFPGPGAKWRISTAGANEPFWARNGELFFRSIDGNGRRMMVVETKTQPTFSASAPRVVFEGAYEGSGSANANYAVTADGQRFVMVKASGPGGASPTQINVVLNWFEELKQRVPVQ